MRISHTLVHSIVYAFVIILFSLLPSSVFAANDYTNSTHGDATIGVNRTSMSGYSIGNCGHCHEQHATIEAAAGGPYNFALFYDNYVTLNPAPDGLCFKCHDGTTDPHDTIINNYSYSFRAGNWPAGNTPNNISDFFNSAVVQSYHNLDDIVTFIDTNVGASGWGYTADSNPCVACHNPHAAQGDPENSAGAKSSGTRGWPLSRPSLHANSPWPLWGDDAAERMNNYTANYQAPYQFNSVTNYEPDGSTVTTNGSNLTDTVTFCTDCHNATNIIFSTTLGRNLAFVDWTLEVHGAGLARDATHDKGTIIAPYNEASASDYVLSCLDCHEPHGSPNDFLLRQEVNGTAVAAPVTTNWVNFCATCHNVTAVGAGGPCNNNTDHGSYASPAGNCINCHGHGQTFCGPGSGGTTRTF
jgi:predicted CXXCH cytochrome family protein